MNTTPLPAAFGNPFTPASPLAGSDRVRLGDPANVPSRAHPSLSCPVRWLGAIMALLLTSTSIPSHARSVSFQADLKHRLFDQASGLPQDVEIRGNLALVATGSGLQIIDIGNPQSATLVASVDLPHPADRLSVYGDLVFVEGLDPRFDSMDVIQISDPIHPDWLGTLTLTVGNTAWLRAPSGQTRTLDISDPAHPIRLRHLRTRFGANDVIVDGNLAFLPLQEAGVLILNVRDPDHPVEAGVIRTRGSAYHLALAGNLAFVAEGESNQDGGFMEVFDVSDPGQAVEVGSLPTDYAIRIAVTDGFAFLASFVPTWNAPSYARLVVIDISDPAQPFLTDFPSDTHANDLEVAGDVLLVASPFSLDLFRVRWPGTPERMASLDTTGRTTMAGNLAFIKWSPSNNLTVMDVTDPARPTQRSLDPSLAWPNRVALAGNLAFLGYEPGYLMLVDARDPASLIPVGGADLPGLFEGVDVDGDLTFVAAGVAGLVILDMEDPANPRQVAVWSGPGPVLDVKVTHRVAYLITGGFLVTLDVKSPNRPRPLGAIEIPEGGSHTARALELAGHLACVATDNRGLHVIDVSDPTLPVWKGALDHAEAYSSDLKIIGNLVLLATRAGLRAVDISDPTRPVWVGGIDTPSRVLNVEVSGNLLYLAEEWRGLSVYEFDVNASPSPAIDIHPSIRLADRPVDFLVIARDGASMDVTLDASGSTDEDGDPLSFVWYAGPGRTLGRESRIAMTAGLGRHTTTLVVNDGNAHDITSVTYDVITPDQAMEWLAGEVAQSGLDSRTKKFLANSLKGAEDAFNRGQTRLGRFRLKLFQLRVRNRLVRLDAPQATSLIQVAQELLNPAVR